jgi:hypothetical protein
MAPGQQIPARNTMHKEMTSNGIDTLFFIFSSFTPGLLPAARTRTPWPEKDATAYPGELEFNILISMDFQF